MSGPTAIGGVTSRASLQASASLDTDARLARAPLDLIVETLGATARTSAVRLVNGSRTAEVWVARRRLLARDEMAVAIADLAELLLWPRAGTTIDAGSRPTGPTVALPLGPVLEQARALAVRRSKQLSAFPDPTALYQRAAGATVRVRDPAEREVLAAVGAGGRTAFALAGVGRGEEASVAALWRLVSRGVLVPVVARGGFTGADATETMPGARPLARPRISAQATNPRSRTSQGARRATGSR